MVESKKEFKRIVVPIDGSKASKKAAKKAFSLAEKTDLDVTLMHVVHIPATALPPTEATVYNPDVEGAVRKKGRDILDEFKEMGSKSNVKIKTKLIEGVPDDEIVKESKKNDLIIMGSKGHSAVGRVLIGSVSEKVLHHSDATVMIVR